MRSQWCRLSLKLFFCPIERASTLVSRLHVFYRTEDKVQGLLSFHILLETHEDNIMSWEINKWGSRNGQEHLSDNNASPMSVKGERWELDDKILSMTYSSEKVLASLMRSAKQRFPVRSVLHQSRWLSYFSALHHWLRGAMGSTISHKHGGWPESVATGGYWLNTILAANSLEMITEQGTFMVTTDQGGKAVALKICIWFLSLVSDTDLLKLL